MNVAQGLVARVGDGVEELCLLAWSVAMIDPGVCVCVCLCVCVCTVCVCMFVCVCFPLQRCAMLSLPLNTCMMSTCVQDRYVVCASLPVYA
jgi:hypothetical protein